MGLLGEGMIVRAYDPEAMDRARAVLPQIEYAKSPYEAAKDAEALILATEWDEFRKLDWDRLHKAMARPFVLDGRNLFSPREMKSSRLRIPLFRPLRIAFGVFRL